LFAGIRTRISAHSFRATGITTYLQNGGKLEVAQHMAGHESARMTGLYDRRDDTVALDEVERIMFRAETDPDSQGGGSRKHTNCARTGSTSRSGPYSHHAAHRKSASCYATAAQARELQY
jgi:hypothetical protein